MAQIFATKEDHQKPDTASWGAKVVDTLAIWLKENESGLKGFKANNK